jgi:hypothetical protein
MAGHGRRSGSVFRSLETVLLVLLVSSTLVETAHGRRPFSWSGPSDPARLDALDITNGIWTYTTLTLPSY